MKNSAMLLKSESENPGFIAGLEYEELTNWAESGAFSALTPEEFSTIVIASPWTISYLADATEAGHPEALNQLVASNAFSGITPEDFARIANESFTTIINLTYAAVKGHPEALNQLAASNAFSSITPEAFASIASESFHTINYLTYAAVKGHPEALNQLAASNAFSSITPEDFAGIASDSLFTIHHLADAAVEGHPEALNQLTASGAFSSITPEAFASIASESEDTISSLTRAARKGHSEALEKLMQTGAITLSSTRINWLDIFRESLKSDTGKGLALLNAAYHQGYSVGEVCDNLDILKFVGIEKTIKIANYRRQMHWTTPALNPVVAEDDLRNIHLSIIPSQLLLAKVLLGRSIPNEIAMKVAQMCRFQEKATLDTPTFTQYFQETLPLHHIAHSIEVVAAGVVQQLYFSIPYIKYKAVTQYRKKLFTALKAFLRGINALDSKTDNLTIKGGITSSSTPVSRSNAVSYIHKKLIVQDIADINLSLLWKLLGSYLFNAYTLTDTKLLDVDARYIFPDYSELKHSSAAGDIIKCWAFNVNQSNSCIISEKTHLLQLALTNHTHSAKAFNSALIESPEESMQFMECDMTQQGLREFVGKMSLTRK
ncbi:hypothetical protein MMH89_01715 [Candidatus Comchoanobacter bicostacola]|uniref:Uncharacterized protein n=1 Tax=Candidatus Comchoanobacter bicostacola TaxID=2919598 RepID=A0ABY5DMJ7_9GAMM|nr:hypothetical protein [Candidatus Comchoanobacter bicostacola]UTC24867.1 hypothetical protein MMH89_01715 [Candidatus Comchoanobacter bicostacola]